MDEPIMPALPEHSDPAYVGGGIDRWAALRAEEAEALAEALAEAAAVAALEAEEDAAAGIVRSWR